MTEAVAVSQLADARSGGVCAAALTYVAMKYLSATEVAEILGFNPATVYRAIERGNLRAIKPPGTNRIRIAEDDFLAWLAAGRLAADSPMPRPKAPARPSPRGRFKPLSDLEPGPGA